MVSVYSAPMHKPPWVGKPKDPPAIRRDDPIERLIDEMQRTLAEFDERPARQRPGRKPKKTAAQRATARRR